MDRYQPRHSLRGGDNKSGRQWVTFKKDVKVLRIVSYEMMRENQLQHWRSPPPLPSLFTAVYNDSLFLEEDVSEFREKCLVFLRGETLAHLAEEGESLHSFLQKLHLPVVLLRFREETHHELRVCIHTKMKSYLGLSLRRYIAYLEVHDVVQVDELLTEIRSITSLHR